VNIFFDTSVLVAASEKSHPHYPQARPALRRVAAAEDQGFISQHSIAEVFATLTRLPIQPRIHPLEAQRIVAENILPYFKVVPLDNHDYLDAMDIMSRGGWSGARIYDALILQCAAKCPAARIYTFNLSDFRQLAPPDLQEKICSP
jgi:predicted nucleic acid-binding protein